MHLYRGDKIQIKDTVFVELLQDSRISGCKLWTAKVQVCTGNSNSKVVFMKYVEFNNRTVVSGLKAEGKFKMYHPNIATVYGAEKGVVVSENCQGEELFCVFMEYVEGIDLLDYYISLQNNSETFNNDDVDLFYDPQKEESSTPDEVEIFSYMMQLLYGVQYYMKCYDMDPFVHRDLKPGNLMLNMKTKKLVIVDFDWVHNHNSNATMNKAKASGGIYAMYGTPGYTDPRLFCDWNTDAKMDIYSIGRIFLFMLSGKHYFSKEEVKGYIELADKDDELLYSLKKERIPKKYGDEKYRFLINTIQGMVAPVKERYDDIDMVITNMKRFLCEYYKDDAENLQKILGFDYILKESKLLPNTFGNEQEILVSVRNLKGTDSKNYRVRNYQVVDLMKDWNASLFLYNVNGEMKYLVYDKDIMRWDESTYRREKHFDTWSYGERKIRIRY